MKKILYLLSLLIIASVILTACEFQRIIEESNGTLKVRVGYFESQQEVTVDTGNENQIIVDLDDGYVLTLIAHESGFTRLLEKDGVDVFEELPDEKDSRINPGRLFIEVHGAYIEYWTEG